MAQSVGKFEPYKKSDDTIEEISAHTHSDQWMVKLELNGVPIKFKIDTGADVTAVSEEIFNKLHGVT